MSQEDQDNLAAQWEAELAKEAEAAGASDTASAAPDAPAAGADAQHLADEALAAQWAASMAEEEEKQPRQSFGGAGAGMGGQAQHYAAEEIGQGALLHIFFAKCFGFTVTAFATG